MEQRLFFGIGLDDDTRTQIGQWLVENVTATKPSTHPDNWHLTLAFLAMVQESQVDTLVDFASSLEGKAFDLRFSETGFWSNNGIFYLKPDNQPQPLLDLAHPLRALAKKMDLYHDNRPFSPHITLFRGCKTQPQLGNKITPFTLRVSKFHLYHSHRNEKGLVYEPIASFLLNHS
ncbi:RNA 2',3'-cyclic phosphodiesterase [Pseudoalteromonas sp. T1lg65]|uniref:RNA 2',3'-cyclic phosphodiesterase n=1 Tax=Pseudoalteromonas sp. T1lg65 TaxID=2077101 RepID=UPI003F795161